MHIFNNMIDDVYIFFTIAIIGCGYGVYESFSQGEIGTGILCLIGCCVLIILWIIVSKYKRRCPKCGTLGAMKTTCHEVAERIPTTKITTVQRNNRSYDIKADATKYIYHHHRKCQNCGYQDYIETEEIKVHR